MSTNTISKPVSYEIDYALTTKSGQIHAGNDMRTDKVGAFKVAAKWLDKGYTVTIKPK
jgi:hypothetical protein